MVRVGVDASVDAALLKSFTKEVQVVRIATEPQGEVEVDFWIPLLPPKTVEGQWPHLKGVRVGQAPWAGVDLLRHLFPPDVTPCGAAGAHALPTSEVAVPAIRPMLTYFPVLAALR